jgi:hypothetical protein
LQAFAEFENKEEALKVCDPRLVSEKSPPPLGPPGRSNLLVARENSLLLHPLQAVRLVLKPISASWAAHGAAAYMSVR